MKEFFVKYQNLIKLILKKSIQNRSENRFESISKKSISEGTICKGESLPDVAKNDCMIESTLPRIRNSKDEIIDFNKEIDVTITKRLKRDNYSGFLKEHWLLTVISGVDKGRQYLATTTQLKIGRKSDNHIYLKDPKVSREHALLKLKGSKWYIKDLQSTNGTKLNNQKIVGEKEIFPGAQITVGDTIIEIRKINP